MNLSSLFSKPLSKVNCDIVQIDEKINIKQDDFNAQSIKFKQSTNLTSNELTKDGYKRNRKKNKNKKLVGEYIDYDKIDDLNDIIWKNQNINEINLSKKLNSLSSTTINDNRRLICYNDADEDTLVFSTLHNGHSEMSINDQSKDGSKNSKINWNTSSKIVENNHLRESIVYDAIYEPIYESESGDKISIAMELNNKFEMPVKSEIVSVLKKEDYVSYLNYHPTTDINMSSKCQDSNYTNQLKKPNKKNKRRNSMLSTDEEYNDKIKDKKKLHLIYNNSELNDIKQDINYVNEDNFCDNSNNNFSNKSNTIKIKKKTTNNNTHANEINHEIDTIITSQGIHVPNSYLIETNEGCINSKKKKSKCTSELTDFKQDKDYVQYNDGDDNFNNSSMSISQCSKNKRLKNSSHQKVKYKKSAVENSNIVKYDVNVKSKSIKKQEINLKRAKLEINNIKEEINNSINRSINNYQDDDIVSEHMNKFIFIDPTITAMEKSNYTDSKVNKKEKGGKKKRKKSLAKLRIYYDRMQKKREKEKEREKITQRKIGTIICKYFSKLGSCNKGDECTFKHEVVKIAEPCKYYMVQSCTKSTNCKYYHNEWPCKFFHIYKNCGLRNNCRFSHDAPNPITLPLFEKMQQEIQLQNEDKVQNRDIDIILNNPQISQINPISNHINLCQSDLNSLELLQKASKDTNSIPINNQNLLSSDQCHQDKEMNLSDECLQVEPISFNFYGSNVANVQQENSTSSKNPNNLLTSSKLSSIAPILIASKSESLQFYTSPSDIDKQENEEDKKVINKSHQNINLNSNGSLRTILDQSNSIKAKQPYINYFTSQYFIPNYFDEHKHMISSSSDKNAYIPLKEIHLPNSTPAFKLIKIDFYKDTRLRVLGPSERENFLNAKNSLDPRLRSIENQKSLELRIHPIIFKWEE